MSDYGFHNSWLPFCEESKKLSFLLASLKTLTNSGNPSSNPLQEACFDFPVAVCDSKSCSESRLCFRKVFRKPAMTCNCKLEKTDQWQRRKAGTEDSDETFRMIFRVKNCFQSSRRKLRFSIFLDSLIILTICACTESTVLF
jgi:hypothetical protein